MRASKASFKVLYNNQDITADVSDDVMQLTYSDKLEGESDDISITFDDKTGKWRGPWYPEKGSLLTVSIFFEGKELKCGTFTIDEIEINSSPDTLTMGAIAANAIDEVRTPNCEAYDNQSLKQIAQSIADRNGYDLQGDVPDIEFTRITQDEETDLAFLQRIAIDYGAIFSLRNGSITFTSIYDLESSNSILSISRSECSSISIKDKVSNTYANCKVRFQDPSSAKLVEVDYSATDIGIDSVSSSVLVIRTKAENSNQAEAKAKAAIYRANSRAINARISVSGNTSLVSGVSFELLHNGVQSGKYHITSSDHIIDDTGGYITNIEAIKTATVSLDLQQKEREPVLSPIGTLSGPNAGGTAFADR